MGRMTLEWAAPEADVYADGCLEAHVWRFDPRDGSFARARSLIIEELPIELRFNGQEPIVMMATPLAIEDFALGFAITEGIVDHASQVLAIDAVPANGGMHVAIEIDVVCEQRVATRRRSGAAASGCGVCGVDDVERALRLPPTLPLVATFSARAIAMAMDALPAFQSIGRQTGSAHAAAYVDQDGQILACAEDAGRHNAVDKLVGMCARRRLDPSKGFCAVTSRASYEMAQKAASAGFPMLCAISAATLQAQRLAVGCGLTLCAFARRGAFECLAAPERILESRLDATASPRAMD